MNDCARQIKSLEKFIKQNPSKNPQATNEKVPAGMPANLIGGE